MHFRELISFRFGVIQMAREKSILFFFTFLAVLASVVAVTTDTVNAAINPTPKNLDISAAINPSCKVGVNSDESITGCRECYPCDDDYIRTYKTKNAIKRIPLTNSSCSNITACCVPLPARSSYSDRAAEEECGDHNPRGHPWRLKARVLDVLPGEYPWRAWVVKDKKVECSATLVSKTSRLLLTTASCVVDIPRKDMKVSFQRKIPKKGRSLMEVEKVIIHTEYKKQDQQNDIAALILTQESEELLPPYATPICIPQPDAFPRDCFTVSEQDIHINTNIPAKEECKKAVTKSDISQTCSVLWRSHHVPEKGSGLACLSDEMQKTNMYTLFGLALYQRDQFTTIYNNVTNHIDWIHERVQEALIY